MSVEALGHVFESSRAEGTARLVLIALANQAGDAADGAKHRVCWPSQRTIAHHANINKLRGTVVWACTWPRDEHEDLECGHRIFVNNEPSPEQIANAERTVRRCVAALEQLGELAAIPADRVKPEVARVLGKHGRSHLYVVTVGLPPEEAAAIVRLVSRKADKLSPSREADTSPLEADTRVRPTRTPASASGGHPCPENPHGSVMDPSSRRGGLSSFEDPGRERLFLPGALWRFPLDPPQGGKRSSHAPRWIYGRIIHVGGQCRLQYTDRSTGQRVHPDRCPALYTLRGLEFVAGPDEPEPAEAAETAGAAT